MVKPSIFFVSGLPRSGSTLLMNLLGQNPNHHVTPTNGLSDILAPIRDKWFELPVFKAQGIEAVTPRILKMIRGMIEGYYTDELKAGKVVFDKSRGWLTDVELLEQAFDRPITILVTVRDVRSIAASFERMFQRYPATARRPPNATAAMTIEGRAMYMMTEGIAGMAINWLRDAMRRQHKSQIVLIPYNQLCRNTQDVLEGLHDTLGLPLFKYDPNNVEQITDEDDSYHGGIPLHKIRSKVELKDEAPWKDILPDALCDRLDRDFADIQGYASDK